jgi:hypothetical protein
MARKPAPRKTTKTRADAGNTGGAPDNPPSANDAPTPVSAPAFAQPAPTDDPGKFLVQHHSDSEAYRKIDALNKQSKLAPMPFPDPRGFSAAAPEPVLTLASVWGGSDTVTRTVTTAQKIVFHAAGDTGSTRGPDTQNLVTDKLVSDFAEADKADIPSFFLHLGDVIYSFGEAQYYYDQFYEPYRDYPAPIIALAGNHDGMVAPDTSTPTLQAFLENFCQDGFVITPQAGGLSRTAQIQPGVFFTFEAPFVRILCLYSNTLEDPGVIADPANGPATIGRSQIAYLKAALARIKKEKFKGALIVAHHHPAYTAGAKHGWSVDMLAQIDAECDAAGVWPHAVLSAHAHNYQRFTRKHGTSEIPYIICGNGGHGLTKLSRKGETLRTPNVIQEAGKATDEVTLESYDDADYGYLRLIATAATLTIEYHPASDGAGMKTPDDSVTVDLASRTLS